MTLKKNSMKKLLLGIAFAAMLFACSKSPASATSANTPTVPELTGTWGFSDGQYISGSVYGTLTFDSQSDTLVLKGDSTYVSMVKRSSSINGSYFGGTGSGTWNASQTSISFSYPLAQGFDYTLSGSSLTLTNGELTLYASRIH